MWMDPLFEAVLNDDATLARLLKASPAAVGRRCKCCKSARREGAALRL